MWTKMEVEIKILPSIPGCLASCLIETLPITGKLMFLNTRVYWSRGLVLFSQVLACALKNSLL